MMFSSGPPDSKGGPHVPNPPGPCPTQSPTPRPHHLQEQVVVGCRDSYQGQRNVGIRSVTFPQPNRPSEGRERLAVMDLAQRMGQTTTVMGSAHSLHQVYGSSAPGDTNATHRPMTDLQVGNAVGMEVCCRCVQWNLPSYVVIFRSRVFRKRA